MKWGECLTSLCHTHSIARPLYSISCPKILSAYHMLQSDMKYDGELFYCRFFPQDSVDGDELANRRDEITHADPNITALFNSDPERLFLFGEPLDGMPPKREVVDYVYPDEISDPYVKTMRRLVRGVKKVLNDKTTEPLVKDASDVRKTVEVSVVSDTSGPEMGFECRSFSF